MWVYFLQFLAVVQRTAESTYLKSETPGREPSGDFIVYPLNLTGGNDNLITGINNVNIDGGRQVKSIKYVNVAGIMSDTPFQGVNIVVTEYTLSTTTKMLPSNLVFSFLFLKTKTQ